ncbi:putative transcriptional regulator [Rhizobium pisi]
MASPTSLKLDDELKGRVQQLAEIRQPHWIMREAIAQYVEREEKRDALRQETLNAWDEIQATGLHVTGDEVENWLSTWGTDDELPTPECHK